MKVNKVDIVNLWYTAVMCQCMFEATDESKQQLTL